MFRRRAGRAFRGFQGPAVPPQLQRAHRMMSAGDYADAAATFHDLARKAEDRFPERAPMFYLEAGRASVLAGEVKQGVFHFRSGLTLLATQQRFQRLQMIGSRIVDELRERGLTAEAEEINLLLKNNLPGGVDAEPSPSKERGALPTHCPSCGAAVRPNEVDWLDDVTAECDYCGSPMRSEQ